MAINWLLLGLVLAGQLLFAIGMAFLVRWMSEKGMHGQTFWMVVLGFAGVLVIASPLIDWLDFVILAACLVVAGFPMGVEYYSRISKENQNARQTLEGVISDHPRADRQD